MGERDRRAGRSFPEVSPRTIVALVLAVLVLVFVALNRDETEISFVVFTATTPVWIALGVAAAGGFAAGFLLGRRTYRV